MIELYHGSLEIVACPEIRKPIRSLDYGSGFYATTSFAQAERWTKRRMQEARTNLGYINVYEMDDERLQDMKMLLFDKPNEQWVSFVSNNRMKEGFEHDYDVVYGPVANDNVYTQFVLYEGGIISLNTLIAELKTYRLVDQYLLHTDKALSLIRFVGYKQISL